MRMHVDRLIPAAQGVQWAPGLRARTALQLPMSIDTSGGMVNLLAMAAGPPR